MEKEQKNTKEAFANAWKKTADFSKKTAGEISKGAKKLSEKAKHDAYERRKRKYNPLFWETFNDKDYKIPNIIKIVDEVVRKDIDVCKGSIGWETTENDNGVLYLYDEVVEQIGIEFFPYPDCNQIYCVDKFDRKKYVQVECAFDRAHNEKITELEHIAYSLGAKSCLIEISESDSQKQGSNSQHSSTNAGGLSVQASRCEVDVNTKTVIDAHSETSQTMSSSRSGNSRTYFSGNDIPKQPDLKWYANDAQILNLIKMRLSNENKLYSRELRISGATTATMSRSTAITIDHLLDESVTVKKANASNRETGKNSRSMISRAESESSRTLIFNIEF